MVFWRNKIYVIRAVWIKIKCSDRKRNAYLICGLRLSQAGWCSIKLQNLFNSALEGMIWRSGVQKNDTIHGLTCSKASVPMDSIDFIGIDHRTTEAAYAHLKRNIARIGLTINLTKIKYRHASYLVEPVLSLWLKEMRLKLQKNLFFLALLWHESMNLPQTKFPL